MRLSVCLINPLQAQPGQGVEKCSQASASPQNLLGVLNKGRSVDCDLPLVSCQHNLVVWNPENMNPNFEKELVTKWTDESEHTRGAGSTAVHFQPHLINRSTFRLIGRPMRPKFDQIFKNYFVLNREKKNPKKIIYYLK